MSVHLPCGGEVVRRCVNDFWLEDVAGLLRHPLAEILVVDLDLGHVAGVAWDDS